MAVRIDILAILVAGVLWGTLSPAGKHLSNLGTDMLTVAFLRAVIMSCGVSAFLVFRLPSAFRVTRKQFLQLSVISGICIVGIYAGFFFALQYQSVPLTVVIFFTHPLLTALGALFITREKPSRYQVGGAMLTLLGVVVAVLPTGGGFSETIHPLGLFWCLFSALAMALYSLVGRLSSQTGFVSQPTLFCYVQIIAVAWLALIKTASTGWADLPALSMEQLGWILYIGLFASMFSYSMYFYSLRTIQAPTASVVSSIEIVTAFSLSALLLSRPPAPREIVGAVLIIMAIILAAMGETRKQAKGRPPAPGRPRKTSCSDATQAPEAGAPSPDPCLPCRKG
ncbi:MAG: DMT family transporter [Synergistota bacterium]|nr:DMT family transporter [Synergistota bacterium]